ncbi:hypothetical protein RFI_25841 [Reticulomyxa filosa]|uniref:Uncharacterized protein n=1 Tax=Reticulomyxa filosa TaxID=46433 RepID=X6MCE4_RETFI|nr:hypothetical protein RFI_25841 [Reticulomyxa filosa]|eukprot:ETO11534.1 hypothetical protein RFI_25841 [Reticulomyxa filosa]
MFSQREFGAIEIIFAVFVQTIGPIKPIFTSYPPFTRNDYYIACEILDYIAYEGCNGGEVEEAEGKKKIYFGKIVEKKEDPPRVLFNQLVNTDFVQIHMSLEEDLNLVANKMDHHFLFLIYLTNVLLILFLLFQYHHYHHYILFYLYQY